MKFSLTFKDIQEKLTTMSEKVLMVLILPSLHCPIYSKRLVSGILTLETNSGIRHKNAKLTLWKKLLTFKLSILNS